MMKVNFRIVMMLILAATLMNCGHTMPARDTIFDSTEQIESELLLELPDAPRVCDNLEVEKRFVDIGDVKLYCEIEGAGTPMVLINGGPGNSHHAFHPWLSEAKSDFQLIYYDQRGCGQSDYEPGQGYSFEQAVEDLEKLRVALKIKKWILVGHSFGGGLAQYYTIKYPEHVIGQVLVGSVPMMNLDAFQGGRDREFYTAPEQSKIDELRSMAITGEITLPLYMFNRDLNGGWKRQYYYKPTRERTIQTGQYDFVADPGYSSDYGVYDFENAFLECPVPTLILEGKYDLIWQADRPTIMSQYHPGASVVVVDQAGHNIFADQPRRFAKAIKDWNKKIAQLPLESLTNWSARVMEQLSPQLELIASSKAFIAMIREKGVEVAVAEYSSKKDADPDAVLFFEAPMNALGYEYLFSRKMDESVEIFKLNVAQYPESWNAYDSLGQALLESGEVELAKLNYRKSIELNPENDNGITILKELELG